MLCFLKLGVWIQEKHLAQLKKKCVNSNKPSPDTKHCISSAMPHLSHFHHETHTLKRESAHTNFGSRSECTRTYVAGEGGAQQLYLLHVYLCLPEKVRKIFHAIGSDTSDVSILSRVFCSKCSYSIHNIIWNLDSYLHTNHQSIRKHGGKRNCWKRKSSHNGLQIADWYVHRLKWHYIFDLTHLIIIRNNSITSVVFLLKENEIDHCSRFC